MSVMSFEEMFGTSGSISASGYTATRTFKVVTGGTVEDFYAIYTHASMPRMYSAFPGTTGFNLSVKDISIENFDDENRVFLVKVNYSKRGVAEPESEAAAETPWTKDPVVDYDFHPVRVNVDSCYHAWVGKGAPLEVESDTCEARIVNSALVPFSEGLVDEDYLMSIIIERAEQSVNPAELKAFQGTLNNAPVSVCGISIGKHEGRIVKVKARRATTPQGVRYYEMRYEILVNSKTHLHQILDAGFMERVAAGADLTNIQENGENVPEPYPLNGAGAKVSAGTTTFTYAKFRVAREASWNSLNLPRSAV